MNLGFNLDEWNATEGRELGDFEVLELGGHEIVIKSAELYTGQSGNTSLKIEVDIAGNDKQAGFFQRQFDENPNADKRWPAGATRYLSLKKESLQYTKGFIETTLPNSNTNFKFDTNKGWEQLKGLKCAGVFGLEEYLDNQGVKRTTTKLQNFRSLNKLSEIKIPRVKLLNNVYVDYETYTNQNNNVPTNIENDFGETVVIDENFLD